jgi:glycosyltransferase involved in cell wall biosynthesis
VAASVSRPRVVVLRGQQANPWDLRPWADLAAEFDVSAPVLQSSGLFATDTVGVATPPARALSDLAPGPLRGIAARSPVNRYRGLDALLAGAAIVHAAELHTWFAAQAAALRRRLGFRLAVTVWETIPFLDAYRHPLSRRNRAAVLAGADLFLAATERARNALLLEGVEPGRVEVCPPGVDIDRFGAGGAAPRDHVVLSPGRLVWEKGHQDVVRAVAALRRGLVGGRRLDVHALIVGSGPEEERLRHHAAELGIADAVELRSNVPYDTMPAVYASASAMVLASLPTPSWEEQFGMVLAEALAAGLPIVASRSGAIPEMTGVAAAYVEPGDWMAIARALQDGPLACAPGARVDHPRELVERWSSGAAAQGLRGAYRRLLER